MKEIVAPLLKWYQKNKRDLEWRKDPTPYTVLISEVMLQQTRVETVRPYYNQFINDLPDFQSLATCKEDRLMKLWEGLGYYSRVRNLKKCAIEIVANYNGCFPKEYDKAIKLPGVGMYTCGAVLSIAYHQKYAAVDGNVLRVLTRYMASSMDISLEKTKQSFKKKLEQIMPDDAGTFNQSLMELGATICMPKVILCEKCPLQTTCLSFQKGVQSSFPVKGKSKEKKIFEYTCLFITDGKQYILVPKETGVLKGMPSPLLLDSFITANEAIEYVSSLQLIVKNALPLKEHKHIFTHQIWYMKSFLVYVKDIHSFPSYTEHQILTDLGVPTCFKKIMMEFIEK